MAASRVGVIHGVSQNRNVTGHGKRPAKLNPRMIAELAQGILGVSRNKNVFGFGKKTAQLHQLMCHTTAMAPGPLC